MKKSHSATPGLAYVRNVLQTGGPLARALGPIDLNAGITTTFLANEVRTLPERLEWGYVGLSKEGYGEMRRAVRDRIASHFAGSKGIGWAIVEDLSDSGLGAFINAKVDGRQTKFKVATAGNRRVLYLTASFEEDDFLDFQDAISIHGNLAALGAGGSLTVKSPRASDWGAEVLPSLAEHVRLIACSAFDAEGLVFWTNRQI